MWLVSAPGSILRLDWGPVLSMALDRYVVVMHPATPGAEVVRARDRLESVGRVARARYRWSRVSNALVAATPVVFVFVAAAASESAGGSTEAGLGPAVPVSLVWAGITFSVAQWCDTRSRRSVRQIARISARHVLVCARLGESAAVRREIARSGSRSIAEQDHLVQLLWRAAEADRARRRYLEGPLFADDEFATILDAAESSHTALVSWTRSSVATGLASHCTGWRTRRAADRS